MRPPRPRALMAAPVAAAVLLAAALVVVAVVAASSLVARDAAVRAGTLLRLSHELETSLREGGPETAAATVAEFCAGHKGEIAGAELSGPRGLVASCGTVGPGAVESVLALGREWRGAFSHPGRGPGGMGMPGARLRLQPAEGLARERGVARLLVAGSAVAGVALVGFALLGVAGLAQRERLAVSQAETRRLEVLAQAGAGLAHRVRNPLAAIKGTAQLLAAELVPPQRERADRVVDASVRIESLLDRLLEFARPPEPHPEPVELAGVAREVAGREVAPAPVRGEADVTAFADREHVVSIVEELLGNARALDPSGTPEIAVRREGRWAVLEVLDRGPGLAMDAERAFQPYVTARPDGTGLGLAIVRALARANGGEVTLAARDGGGCVARLRVPAREG